MRRETGVMQDPGDWPGVFIRGDDAMRYALALSRLIAEVGRAEDFTASLERGPVLDLRDLLGSCIVTREES